MDQPVEWPSAGWLAHFAVCRPRDCDHRLPLPDWWLAMSSRFTPMGSTDEEALQAAIKRVARFKGYPKLDEDEAEFVRALVADALPAAPQPITHAWVDHTLGVVGNLARWASGEGLALDRDVLLSPTHVNRWLHVGMRTNKPNTRAVYRARIEIIMSHVLTEPWSPKHLPIEPAAPLQPLSAQHQADLWLWASNLPTRRWRACIMSTIVLSAGCGLKRGELLHVRRDDVERDLAGVRVHVTHPADQSPGPRTVTCAGRWEQKLWALAKDVTPGHTLVSPWRGTPQAGNSHDAMVKAANLNFPPPVPWGQAQLRNTWFCEHLTAGTPLNVLLPAAGIRSLQTVERLLPYVDAPDAVDASRWLRGSA